MKTLLALSLALASCSAPTKAPSTSARLSAVTTAPSFVIVHQLTDAEGASPRGHLVERGGRLYGLAGEAGPNGSTALGSCYSTANWDSDAHLKQCPGSLFSIALDGSDLRVEHAFTVLDAQSRNQDGYHPYGSPSIAPDGRLWGVTQAGGTSPGCDATAAGGGVVWSYGPETGDFRVEHHFCSEHGAADGKNPMGVVSFFGGAAYGTAKGNINSGNSQVVWRVSGSGFAHSPSSTAFGWSGYGGLTATPTGLVGMTVAGYTNGRGAYYAVDPATLAVTPTWAFPAYTPNAHGTDNPPIQAPTILSNGAIVAAREFGGAFGTGLVVDLSAQVVLKEFDDIPLSAVPRFSNATAGIANGRLVEGRDGLLYGTGMYGGAYGAGGVYRIARDGTAFQLLYSSPAGVDDPSRSYGGLTLGSDGHFYGVTFYRKSIFRYDPPTSSAVCAGAQ